MTFDKQEIVTEETPHPNGKAQGLLCSSALLAGEPEISIIHGDCLDEIVKLDADKLEMLFVLKPSVSGEWASETGRYAALQLGDKMDMVAEAIEFGETMHETDDVDALIRFEIAPAKVSDDC